MKIHIAAGTFSHYNGVKLHCQYLCDLFDLHCHLRGNLLSLNPFYNALNCDFWNRSDFTQKGEFMAHAYTPGLKVAAGTTIRNERRLPIEGEVTVQVGDKIEAADVVAKASLPGNVQLVNIANLLSIPTEDIRDYMLKTEGEPIGKAEIIGETKGLFGLFKSQARAPTDGTIESISDVTGQVIIREAPIPVNVMGHISGSVVEVISNEGAIVEAYGTYIQGIFGVGGETVGALEVVADSPDAALTHGSSSSLHIETKSSVAALWLETMRFRRQFGRALKA